ncbi:hypothetical protein FJY69_00555 [candidate division WOR-3 bacterium]|nr:hypothetical protein [candidate division WOR-3 bacterium]
MIVLSLVVAIVLSCVIGVAIALGSYLLSGKITQSARFNAEVAELIAQFTSEPDPRKKAIWAIWLGETRSRRALAALEAEYETATDGYLLATIAGALVGMGAADTPSQARKLRSVGRKKSKGMSQRERDWLLLAVDWASTKHRMVSERR